MTLEHYIIKKENLDKVLKKLSEEYEVYVPCETDGYANFGVYGSCDINLDFTNSRVPPLKNILFPETETMYRYEKSKDGYNIVPATLDNTKRVIFGARCCDCAGMVRIDEKIYQEPKDPYYDARRKNMTVLALACNEPPSPACFCTSVGGSPHGKEGADILLTDLGTSYLAQIITDKGKSLLETLEWAEESSEESLLEVKRLHEHAESLLEELELNWTKLDFKAKMWEEESRRCIACGICAFLCPSCSCFTLETVGTPKNGKVVRIWESCQFPAYSLEASGHNPRPNKSERLRQRAFDKYYYSQKKHEGYDCVGCGRCIDRCPVNIDVREMLLLVEGA